MSEKVVKRVLVLVDTSGGWGRRVIKGVANFAQKTRGWQLSVTERGIDELVRFQGSERVDGVIARIGHDALAQDLADSGLPVVNVSAIELEGCDFPRVQTSERQLAQLAIEHFRARGYRNLAFFGQYGSGSVAHSERRGERFHAAAEELGLHCDVFTTEDTADLGSEEVQAESLRHWLEGVEKPVGILAWDSVRARAVLNACMECGVSVPEDVAVLAGEDDNLLGEVCFPSMSGIVTAAEQIGHEAARMLDSMMDGDDVPIGAVTRLTPESITVRMSTDTLAVDDPLLRKAIHYIRENINKPMQVEDVAKAVGASRRSLERRFSNTLGHSPAKEVQNCRFNLAKKLLRETEMSVADVAQASGYCSNEYMIRVFKQSVQQTPLKYRVAMRGKG